MKPERDGARPGLENFQQKIIVAHIDLNAKHTKKKEPAENHVCWFFHWLRPLVSEPSKVF
ncbi:MAG: hypothetical protein UY54_C0002G0001 [Parcubacteria group bacterium GW2011_GWA2_50_10b]|nr:MAG: hypothetical protein UY54_C0002G0001 [Parcubacteria group bacterium GW2011_GWA2_50_10b]